MCFVCGCMYCCFSGFRSVGLSFGFLKRRSLMFSFYPEPVSFIGTNQAMFRLQHKIFIKIKGLIWRKSSRYPFKGDSMVLEQFSKTFLMFSKVKETEDYSLQSTSSRISRLPLTIPQHSNFCFF